MKRHPMWLTVFLALIWTNTVFAHGRTKSVVLIHGAWHGAWAWHVTASMLESSGYDVYVPDLPGHGIDGTAPAAVTLDAYVQKVVSILDSLSEPAVLIGHSMGGIVVSQTGEARPSRVAKLVYLAAFMPLSGQSALALASEDTGSMVLSNSIVDPANGTIDIRRDDIADTFYSESRPEYVTLASALLRPNPLGPVATPLVLTASNYGRLPRYYIRTSNDLAVTPAIQDRMIHSQPCKKVYPIESDHSPFFSHPRQLNAILQRILAD